MAPGGVHAAGGESAGNGGFLGSNSVSGASLITTNGNTTWTSAGQIEITHAIVLPVTWLSFTGSKQSSGVLLTWSTAIEQNTKDYKVQHSVNGTNWIDIGIVPAAGNSNTVQQYSFVDQNPGSSLNYYRLLQRDIDGNSNYSKVVSLNFSGAEPMLKIYPNPVLNGTITVSLQKAAIVEIYNSTGVKVMQKEFLSGEHLFNLSQLSKGTYYMKAKDDAVLFVIQ